MQAYGVLANRGIRNDPLFVLKVEDKSGNVLEKNSPRPVEVLSEGTASVMTSMLRSVMDHGTGYPARARGLTIPAAGKTVTMDDYRDAWFVGYIPSLACGTWVGYDDKRIIGPGMTGVIPFRASPSTKGAVSGDGAAAPGRQEDPNPWRSPSRS